MIPFHRPWTSGEELRHIAHALEDQGGAAGRHYTRTCEQWLETLTGCHRAFLTPSCTAALEMTALLARIRPGDEVIMASFTFPSMANAFVLRGGVPVFVDIRSDTLNIDETRITAAITSRTRAIVAMHYGGVACEMDTIMAIAERHGLIVIEDAAHAIGATYKGRQLGSIGHLATLSFHRTKNIQCGEGGALLVNAPEYVERTGVIRENGTDRASFLDLKVPHYSWIDLGTSCLISEFSAAFLWAQMAGFDHVLEQRRKLWLQYQATLRPATDVPVIEHNAHIFHVLAESRAQRQQLMDALLIEGIQSVPHYQPLHSSEAGLLYGKVSGDMAITDRVAATLLRLPLWVGLTTEEVEHICARVAALAPPTAPLSDPARRDSPPHSVNI
ncbi:MAG: rffA [Moraxellaceae bacterium]|jgi:dTDP-4-amino-4,6-dideoxygalactose transaminase|nr:rffA [Moraxellaceae bacterium]